MVQVAAAISEAPSSRLSSKMQSQVQLAHLAFDAICASCRITFPVLAKTQASPAASTHHQAKAGLHQLGSTLTAFVSSVTQQKAMSRAGPGQAACAELYSEQLLIIAKCCHMLCCLTEHAAQDVRLQETAGQLVSMLLQKQRSQPGLVSFLEYLQCSCTLSCEANCAQS